jgi:hypothetical protein
VTGINIVFEDGCQEPADSFTVIQRKEFGGGSDSNSIDLFQIGVEMLLKQFFLLVLKQ